LLALAEKAKTATRKLSTRETRPPTRSGRKSPTPTLRSLLPILLVPVLMTIPSPTFAQGSETGYETVLTRPTYQRAEVLDFLAIANEEADKAIKKAFDEGYKAAALDYAPRVAALEVENAAMKDQLKAKKAESAIFPFALAGSFAAGMVSGALVGGIGN
jgi:hypothetical protein